MPSRLLRDTLVLYSKNMRGDHQYIASAEHYLGEALLAQQKYREAEIVLTRSDGALETHRRARLAFRAFSQRARRSTAWTGTNDEAEQYLVDSYRELERRPGRRQRQQAYRARTRH